MRVAKDISFYHDNDNCPTCKQELQVDFKLSKMDDKNKQLAEIDEAIEKLEEEKKVAQARDSEINEVQKQIDLLSKQALEMYQKMNICQATIQSLETNILHVKNQSKKIEEDATVLETLRNDLNEKIEEKKTAKAEKTKTKSKK